MPPATLRRRPLPLFIASSKITSSVGADSVSARRFPTNGHLLYTAGPGMPGPYSVVVCFPRCHFCQNPPPARGLFLCPHPLYSAEKLWYTERVIE